MTTNKLSEETEQKIVNPNPIKRNEKRPMDVYGWVFKLYGRFCVW